MAPQDNLLSAKLDTVYREDSEKELSPPSGFCFNQDGNLLLADDFNHRIQIYDSQHNLLHSFGSKGKEPGQFQYPKGIAADPDGNIYVADCWNHRIQKFDSKGTPLLSFGACGDGKGELNEPYDILIEPSGNLIVVERYNHRIQFFDTQGVSLGCLGDRGTVLEEQLTELQGSPPNILAPPLFELPTSIASDSKGNYFITDSGNHRVRKFDSRWQEIMSFGEYGTEPGQFQYPQSVTVAPNDLLYVADLNNERVQVFSSFGQYLLAIDGASSGEAFEAPCITAIDLKGCLHIGFTFNTKIFKYLIPLVSQNTFVENLGTHSDPSHVFYKALVHEQEGDTSNALTALEKTFNLLNENQSQEKPSATELKLKAANLLGRLSNKGVTIADNTFEHALSGAEEKLRQERDSILSCFSTWQEKALKFNGLLLEEQKLIMKDPNGIRDFNRDLHIAEQEDKKHYRFSRNLIHSYRISVKQFSRFLRNSIANGLPESQLESLIKVLLRQTGETLGLMKEHFGQKEKSEESMVQILGESQGEKDKLSTFLAQYYANDRIMDLQQHLQFELQSHWFSLRNLSIKTRQKTSLENLAGKRIGDTSAYEDIIKILIGFHEDSWSYTILEQEFLNSLDVFLRSPESSETTTKTDLTLADFTPVPYDSENLDFDGAISAFKAEGSSLRKKNDTIVWGQDVFQFPDLTNHKEELASCALKLLENQSNYQGKAQELIQQLEDVVRQRNDLDIQLKQSKVEDKISPITINDNIAIVQFQVNLIRRMIMSLDINQSLNLHRLILAGALLSLDNNESKDAQRFFQTLNDYHIQQDKIVLQESKSRKENVFKLSSLHSQLDELKSKYDISEISDTLKVEAENAQVQIKLDRSEFELQRDSRVKNFLDKLVEFRGQLSNSNMGLRETRILEIADVRIGYNLAPQGICHNEDGNLLVTGYENHQVHSYSRDGDYQFHFGGWGTAPGNMQYPNNIAIDSEGSIYVIVEKAQLIKKFDKDGNYLFQFGSAELGMVFSLSIDSQDNIWVADPEHNRIIIFDKNGAEVRVIPADQPSENLNEPVSICCLPNGEYLTGDRSESLLKHYDSQNNLLHKADKADREVDDIYFMAWHPKHGIFGSDFWNGQIVHFNHKLEVQKIYHKPGKRAGQFGKVGGLSCFNDQLAVANMDLGKVQIFDLSS